MSECLDLSICRAQLVIFHNDRLLNKNNGCLRSTLCFAVALKQSHKMISFSNRSLSSFNVMAGSPSRVRITSRSWSSPNNS